MLCHMYCSDDEVADDRPATDVDPGCDNNCFLRVITSVTVAMETTTTRAYVISADWFSTIYGGRHKEGIFQDGHQIRRHLYCVYGIGKSYSVEWISTDQRVSAKTIRCI